MWGLAGIWMLKHWKDLLIGLVVIACAGFVGSFLLRGAKIERLEIKIGSIELKAASDLQECQAFGEGVADALREINKTQKENIRKGQLREKRLEEGLAAVTVLADEEHRRAVRIEHEVSVRIDAAETCEDKQNVFLRAMQERIDG